MHTSGGCAVEKPTDDATNIRAEWFSISVDANGVIGTVTKSEPTLTVVPRFLDIAIYNRETSEGAMLIYVRAKDEDEARRRVERHVRDFFRR